MPELTRGRPRDPRIDARVLAAAVAELAEKGIAEFSVRGVASRAHVDRRGVHARWPRTDDLVVDALATLTAGLQPPATGSLRADLEALVPDIAAALSGARRQVLQRCLDEVAVAPEITHRFRRDHVDRCSAVVEDAFHRARERGELSASTSPAGATELLMGSLLVRALLQGDAAVDADGQRRVLDHVLGLTLVPGRAAG
ncbi:TetR-like C-terminal domain-containing protein [Kineococcus rhizosphaerae]|uniref:TetR family transcriptional regulator n=1 Tax=Kineococcus rhizosphaerae TaxID=559628 RepID=A0A2T0QXK8_9ACTN|nr:TetR-like C-terminal domain-containing protein [Kineococcus rhizosphaerae]PRY10557.1 TetR family transcriptional regulator [Kineococcus rhizosphaerae]